MWFEEAEEAVNHIPCPDTRVALKAILDLISYVWDAIPMEE